MSTEEPEVRPGDDRVPASSMSDAPTPVAADVPLSWVAVPLVSVAMVVTAVIFWQDRPPPRFGRPPMVLAGLTPVAAALAASIADLLLRKLPRVGRWAIAFGAVGLIPRHEARFVAVSDHDPSVWAAAGPILVLLVQVVLSGGLGAAMGRAVDWGKGLWLSLPLIACLGKGLCEAVGLAGMFPGRPAAQAISAFRLTYPSYLDWAELLSGPVALGLAIAACISWARRANPA